MNVSPTPLPIAPRFTRSVNLQRDFTDVRSSIVGYQVTPLVIQTTERVMQGLQPTSTARAFSLIGPYGSGKSAFALFLAHYLGHGSDKRRQIIKNHSMNGLLEGSMYNGPILLPVLLSGNNSALRYDILRAIHAVLINNPQWNTTGQSLLNHISTALTTPDLDPQQVASIVEQSGHLIAQGSQFSGILLIIDELGQYLDYAAHQGNTSDLFVLQALAEMAARSGTKPCVILTILHQAFERYILTAGTTRRTEFAKVQGRFIDLPFQEPTSQMLRMVVLMQEFFYRM